MNYGHGYRAKNRSKYGSKRVVIDGQKFDSQKEADRWQELKWMERAGMISGLERQVHFQLTPAVYGPDIIGPKGGRKKGKVILEKSEYIADFCYTDNETEKYIVEDVKGYKTAEYILKKKMLYHLRGIMIHET